MATSWKSQISKDHYSLQFETDDKEKYKAMEKAAQIILDGGKLELKTAVWHEDTEYYDDDYSECNVRKIFVCSCCGRTELKPQPYCNCGAMMLQ